MLMSTLSVDNMSDIDIKGIVSANMVIGISYFKDFGASLRDVFGGRCKSYEQEFDNAREYVLAELERKAVELGGNAVHGIHVEIEAVGPKNSMFLISAYGTAVRTKAPKKIVEQCGNSAGRIKAGF